MGRFIYQLRSRRRFIQVWLLLGGLAIWYSVSQSCRGSNSEFCAAPAQWLLDRVLIGGGLVLGFTVLFVAYRRYRNRALRDGSFRHEPWRYDGAVVEIEGRIARVIKPRASYRFKNSITNILRTLTDNRDPSGRSTHQVYLLRSPQIRGGMHIAIFHNEKFGKIHAKKGDWVSVRGEYLHQRAKEKSALGFRLSHYGRVHFTHEPKGWFRILRGKSELSRRPDVLVVTRRNHNPQREDFDSLYRDKKVARPS